MREELEKIWKHSPIANAINLTGWRLHGINGIKWTTTKYSDKLYPVKARKIAIVRKKAK